MHKHPFKAKLAVELSIEFSSVPSELHLTRTQYRYFAEITKANGCILEIHEPEERGSAWGEAGIMAMSVVHDATDPHTLFCEHGYISLATRIDTIDVRADSRPEIDLTAVPLLRLYEFILWHEIAHKVWNFPLSSFFLSNPGDDKYDLYYAKAQHINEVLADRFAWARVFPGKVMPVRKDLSFADRRQIDLDMEYLEGGLGALKLKLRERLPAGQYKSISTRMLKDEEKASWVGPKAMLIAPSGCEEHLVSPDRLRDLVKI